MFKSNQHRKYSSFETNHWCERNQSLPDTGWGLQFKLLTILDRETGSYNKTNYTLRSFLRAVALSGLKCCKFKLKKNKRRL